MRVFAILLVTAATPLFAESAPLTRWEPVAKPWDRGLGTHRVVLKAGEIPAGTKAVTARMEWRRPDREPEKKAVLVYDQKTGKQVQNVEVEKVSGDEGVVTFEPVSGPGEYAVYFLPVKIEGGAFPVSRYLPPQTTADAAWRKQFGTGGGGAVQKTQAEVARWEAISAHDAWTEMEVMATEAECSRFGSDHSSAFFVYGIEPAEKTVRVLHQLASPLTKPGKRTLTARPGQYFVFQVVVMSNGPAVPQTKIIPGPAVTLGGDIIPTPVRVGNLSCAGTDWLGRTVERTYDIPRHGVQPFWLGVPIPPAMKKEGEIRFKVQIMGNHIAARGSLDVVIKVSGEPVKDHGDADPQSLSRLRWLNSTTAIDDEPVKGYTPLEVKGRTIRCLGRELELGDDGLPVQIRSYFNKAVTKVMDKPTLELLQKPVFFYTNPALSADPSSPAQPIHRTVSGSGIKFTRQSPGAVEWTAQLVSDGLKGTVNGRMESDGFVKYGVTLEAADTPKKPGNIGINFLRRGESMDYVLGLQQETGALKMNEPLWWKWDVANKHQDSLWMGAVNGGLRVQFKAENYVRPGVNIHYKRRPLNNPPSWNASGSGAIVVSGEKDGIRGFGAGSGPVTLEPGKPLHFDFDLLITPFHPLRTKEQWADRYYHTGGVPQDYNKYLDSAKAAGANVVNIHQGNWLNPYINYPFLTWEKLGDFSKASHERGLRAKYYYTVRELSNWCPEIFALRSMGDEILMSGKGGGHPWGEEHLGGNYWQAWYEPGVQDVSFLTQPMSRFHNYYIEGLRWLCENAGCDGIYLDDIAYDRSIMLRARKVLDRYCPRGGLIDLHSWNEFHEGGAWAHCPNIFMDSMPFVDRLWFGEGHHYSGPPPEHFLVELSGIPFGLMGEMLEGGGNPWLGLVHGCTGRLGWGGSPQSVWKLWDDFGVQDAEFIGWWAGDECPVRCADPLVKATVWKKADATLVAVANFSREAKPASLTIDWSALGRDPAKTKLYFPPVAAPLKQKASLTTTERPLLLKPYSGAVFILDEKPHDLAAPPAAEAPGAIILNEDFTRGLDKAWTPVLSPHAKEGTRLDAGYVLHVPANVHAFLERSLPAETGAVSARVWQDGKDQGQQWGPGLAVIWPDGKTLRANIRQDGRLTVSANGGENLNASASARAPVEFTIRWDKEAVKIIAAGPGMGDLPEEIARFPRSEFPGQPVLLRAGKMPNSSRPEDHALPGTIGFNRLEWVRTYRNP